MASASAFLAGTAVKGFVVAKTGGSGRRAGGSLLGTSLRRQKSSRERQRQDQPVSILIHRASTS